MRLVLLPASSVSLKPQAVSKSKKELSRRGCLRCVTSCSRSRALSVRCNHVQTAYLVGSSLHRLCVASAQQRAIPQESHQFSVKQATHQTNGNGHQWHLSKVGQSANNIPWQMTAYIKSERQQAVQAAKRDPHSTIPLFTCRMEQLCQQSDEHLNIIHVNAILNGAARVWTTGISHSDAWTQPEDAEFQDFLHSMLKRTQGFLPNITSRSASNLLWSFAKMETNPDRLVYGIVDSLAQRFMEDIEAATGQSYATFLLACADLNLNPCDGQMLPKLLIHLDSKDLSQLDRQAVVNAVHGLARLWRAEPSPQLLDKLCACFLAFLWSPEKSQRPPSMEVASFAWALQTLRHVPPREVSSSLLARMLSLCRLEGQQPKAQEISNFLLGWAELRLAITQAETDALVSQFLNQSMVRQQEVANVAWSLAVAGRLQLHTYRLLLQRMLALAAHGRPPLSLELTQMHQALHGVQMPAQISPQGQALLSKTQASLRTLGPVVLDTRFLSNYGLFVALTDLDVVFQTCVIVKAYYAQAVVQPQVSSVRPIIIMLEYGQMDHCFSNDVSRLAGREAYCRKLLSQHGILVVVPPHVVLGGEEILAGYLRTALDAAASGDLNAYRNKKQ